MAGNLGILLEFLESTYDFSEDQLEALQIILDNKSDKELMELYDQLSGEIYE